MPGAGGQPVRIFEGLEPPDADFQRSLLEMK